VSRRTCKGPMGASVISVEVYAIQHGRKTPQVALSTRTINYSCSVLVFFKRSFTISAHLPFKEGRHALLQDEEGLQGSRKESQEDHESVAIHKQY
jgi:hypothetical protein